MKTWKSFVKRNIEWMILSAVLFFLHVLYLFLIGRTGDDLIYAGILDPVSYTHLTLPTT